VGRDIASLQLKPWFALCIVRFVDVIALGNCLHARAAQGKVSHPAPTVCDADSASLLPPAPITNINVRLCNRLATIAEQANAAFTMGGAPNRWDAMGDFTRRRVQIRTVLVRRSPIRLPSYQEVKA